MSRKNDIVELPAVVAAGSFQLYFSPSLCHFVCDWLENSAHDVNFCFQKRISISKQGKEKCPRCLIFTHLGHFTKAEREGFEPSRRYQRLHDFQSCAFDQLSHLSMVKLSTIVLWNEGEKRKVVRVTGLEPVRRNTRPSNVPVCQFQHTRIDLDYYSRNGEKSQAFFSNIS